MIEHNEAKITSCKVEKGNIAVICKGNNAVIVYRKFAFVVAFSIDYYVNTETQTLINWNDIEVTPNSPNKLFPLVLIAKTSHRKHDIADLNDKKCYSSVELMQGCDMYYRLLGKLANKPINSKYFNRPIVGEHLKNGNAFPTWTEEVKALVKEAMNIYISDPYFYQPANGIIPNARESLEKYLKELFEKYSEPAMLLCKRTRMSKEEEGSIINENNC